MSEGFKIALTAVAGVSIFVVGQLLQRFLIEPLQDWRRVRGRIAHALLFYGNAYATPGISQEGKDRLNNASVKLRDLAADLMAVRETIPLYGTLSLGGWLLPTKDNIQTASSNLIGWSNSLFREDADNAKRQQLIAKALGITLGG